jgi:hypothetical protein
MNGQRGRTRNGAPARHFFPPFSVKCSVEAKVI